MINRKCSICNKEFSVPPSWQKRGFYCSQKCYGISKKGRPSWNKGLKVTCNTGRTWFKKGFKPKHYKGWQKSSQGYILILNKNHPFCDTRGYVFRSRLVMEKHLKRYLEPYESVHHLNRVKDDDRLENLILFPSKAKHISFHQKERYGIGA